MDFIGQPAFVKRDNLLKGNADLMTQAIPRIFFRGSALVAGALQRRRFAAADRQAASLHSALSLLFILIASFVAP